MKELRIKLPYEKILLIKIEKAKFLLKEFINTKNLSGERYFIEESIPVYFSGKYYSYENIMFFQNYINNYFYSMKKYSFDDEIVIMNWVRYIISYVLKKHFLNFHGSIIKYKGRIYFFVGNSGSGKTTISYYFMKKGGTVYSDEFALLNNEHSSFIPRPFYFRNELLKNKKSEYSKILYGRYSKVENKREIELLPKPEKIFFLSRDKKDKYYLFLESIHKFDFFKENYYTDAIKHYDDIKSGFEIIKWDRLKELKDFVDKF